MKSSRLGFSAELSSFLDAPPLLSECISPSCRLTGASGSSAVLFLASEPGTPDPPAIHSRIRALAGVSHVQGEDGMNGNR